MKHIIQGWRRKDREWKNASLETRDSHRRSLVSHQVGPGVDEVFFSAVVAADDEDQAYYEHSEVGIETYPPCIDEEEMHANMGFDEP